MLAMIAQTSEAFRKAVMMMKILKSSKVVVGLSGSSDSVALTYLAKQTFPKVLAMTVNLNMNEENTRKAEKAAEIAQTLGVAHHVVTLDWAEGERRMTESVAGYRRYPALMEQCRRVGAGVLMMAHSLDDQIEMVVYRMSKGSGVEGLGGMVPLSYWVNYPDIGIARPLLDCSRVSLEEVCREAGLPWTDRGSTNSDRGIVKSVTRKHEGLKDGLLELMSVCREARNIANPQVAHTVKNLPAVDTQLGTLSFPLSLYQSLNPAIARRALSLWIRYIGGVSDFRYNLVVPMHRLLFTHEHPTVTGSNIILTIDPTRKKAMIARRSPDSQYRVKVPISVGETILWDNRFKISLVHRKSEERGDGTTAPGNQLPSGDSPVFYVRHLVQKDWPYISKGGVKYKLPPSVRGGLPVVVDKENKIVLIPHFRVARCEANVLAVVRFMPGRSVEDLLQYSYCH